jgi:tetratricopeptide (TPR) repeat protein
VRLALAAAAIAAAGILSHLPLAGAEYVQDDHLAVEDNVVVTRGDLGVIFAGSYWQGARGEDGTLYRPVTILSYALEQKLTGRPSPLVSHLVNVLLHVLAALALAALARRIGGSRGAAVIAGLLFALHPVLTEAVANVVGRAEILAALFTLAALLAHTATGIWNPAGAAPTAGTAGSRRLASWGAAAFLFLALGSKETAIAGVGLLVVQELLFRPPSAGKLRLGLIDRAAALAPSALAVVLHGILRIRALEAVFPLQTVPAADNPLVRLDGVERIATALAIAARYARLLILPVPLSADYSGHVITAEGSLLAPHPLAGAAFLAIWLLLALLPILVLAARRRSAAPRSSVPVLVLGVSFAAALFLFPYLVIGNLLFRVGAGIAERFLYLPCAGYCLVLALVIGRVAEGEIAFVPGSLAQRRRLVGLALTLLLSGFAMLTAVRCFEWRNDRTVFEAAARVNPASPRAHYIVATLDTREGRYADALRGIDTVLRLWPEYLAAWVQKGVVLGQQGDSAGAEAACREAIRLAPDYAPAHSNLGIALHRMGKIVGAEQSLRRALLWDPALDQAWAELGNVLFEQRRFREAAEAYARALALGRSAVAPRLKEARRQAAA